MARRSRHNGLINTITAKVQCCQLSTRKIYTLPSWLRITERISLSRRAWQTNNENPAPRWTEFPPLGIAAKLPTTVGFSSNIRQGRSCNLLKNELATKASKAFGLTASRHGSLSPVTFQLLNAKINRELEECEWHICHKTRRRRKSFDWVWVGCYQNSRSHVISVTETLCADGPSR